MEVVSAVGYLKGPRLATSIVDQTSAILYRHSPMMERASTARRGVVQHGKSCVDLLRVATGKLFLRMASVKIVPSGPEPLRVLEYACLTRALHNKKFWKMEHARNVPSTHLPKTRGNHVVQAFVLKHLS